MRITQKQLNAAMKSYRLGLDGIGYNDTWNVANFGLTSNEYYIIMGALHKEYGGFLPCRPSLRAVNARLAAV